MYYIELLEALVKNNVQYLLVGGVAVNLFGVTRFTNDIDFILALDEENLKTFVQVVLTLGYEPRLPVKPFDLADEEIRAKWISERNMIAFSFYNAQDQWKIFYVVLVSPLTYEEMATRKQTIKLKSLNIYCASLDDLITLKQFSGRPQDVSDIELLRQIMD